MNVECRAREDFFCVDEVDVVNLQITSAFLIKLSAGALSQQSPLRDMDGILLQLHGLNLTLTLSRSPSKHKGGGLDSTR